jgi:hypothetical protein
VIPLVSVNSDIAIELYHQNFNDTELLTLGEMDIDIRISSFDCMFAPESIKHITQVLNSYVSPDSHSRASDKDMDSDSKIPFTGISKDIYILERNLKKLYMKQTLRSIASLRADNDISGVSELDFDKLSLLLEKVFILYYT